jgi:hypothetical protein
MRLAIRSVLLSFLLIPFASSQNIAGELWLRNAFRGTPSPLQKALQESAMRIVGEKRKPACSVPLTQVPIPKRTDELMVVKPNRQAFNDDLLLVFPPLPACPPDR